MLEPLPFEDPPEEQLNYQPDTWNFANATEDAVLDALDFKFNCEAILNGEAIKVPSKEIEFVAKLILVAPKEFLDLAKSPISGRFNSCGLRDLLMLFGLNIYKVDKAIQKIFSKKIENYIIIKQNREERKMAEKLLNQLDMAEILEIAKELDVDVQGKKKVDAAKVLMAYIDGIPEEEPLSESVKMWFNVALRLEAGEAKTMEEAKQQELEAIAEEKGEASGKEETAEEPVVEEVAEEPAEEVQQETKKSEGEEVKKMATKKKEAKKPETKTEAAAVESKKTEAAVGNHFREGSSAYACFEAMRVSGGGITIADAVKKLEGKVETSNLESRVKTIFAGAVRGGKAKKDGDKFIALAG